MYVTSQRKDHLVTEAAGGPVVQLQSPVGYQSMSYKENSQFFHASCSTLSIKFNIEIICEKLKALQMWKIVF